MIVLGLRKLRIISYVGIMLESLPVSDLGEGCPVPGRVAAVCLGSHADDTCSNHTLLTEGAARRPDISSPLQLFVV